jgi:amphi-Trp domain-containing protein
MREPKPMTEILIDYEEKQSLVAFATTLETIAKKLKEQGSFQFVQGTKAISITPSEQLKVEYSYTKKADKHSFEIEFYWSEGQKEIPSMSIE